MGHIHWLQWGLRNGEEREVKSQKSSYYCKVKTAKKKVGMHNSVEVRVRATGWNRLGLLSETRGTTV